MLVGIRCVPRRLRPPTLESVQFARVQKLHDRFVEDAAQSFQRSCQRTIFTRQVALQCPQCHDRPTQRCCSSSTQDRGRGAERHNSHDGPETPTVNQETCSGPRIGILVVGRRRRRQQRLGIGQNALRMGNGTYGRASSGPSAGQQRSIGLGRRGAACARPPRGVVVVVAVDEPFVVVVFGEFLNRIATSPFSSFPSLLLLDMVWID